MHSEHPDSTDFVSFVLRRPAESAQDQDSWDYYPAICPDCNARHRYNAQCEARAYQRAEEMEL